NVQVPFANAAGRRTEAQALLNKATLETPAKWEFYVRSNSVIVLTCRPADAARLIAALESK
ncbi:MAG TPA: hypothetical protein VFL42_02675, partial [Terriglobales bacterium]|nr:hypothetical protein [Terriglobales bacterium]